MTTNPDALLAQVAKALFESDNIGRTFSPGLFSPESVWIQVEPVYMRRARAVLAVAVEACARVLDKSASDYNEDGDHDMRNVLLLRADEIRALAPSRPRAHHPGDDAVTTLDEYEAAAAEFFADTSYMAPGKDDRRHYHTHEERRAAWEAWGKMRRKVDAAFARTDEGMTREHTRGRRDRRDGRLHGTASAPGTSPQGRQGQARQRETPTVGSAATPGPQAASHPGAAVTALSRLRAAAEAATPGEWSSAALEQRDENGEPEDVGAIVYGTKSRIKIAQTKIHEGDPATLRAFCDADFIAAANPAVVLALIARCEAAERVCEATRAALLPDLDDDAEDAAALVAAALDAYDRAIAAASEGKT